MVIDGKIYDCAIIAMEREKDMRKKHETFDSNSCLNRAKDDEILFVLLGRDKTAPATIRFWCGQRILSGKNKQDDPQIVDALKCARLMETENESD